MSPRRFTTVFVYHLGRVLGWNDKDRVALLLQKDRPLRYAWVVKREPTAADRDAGGKEAGGRRLPDEFSIPSLTSNSRLGVKPYGGVTLPPGLSGPPLAKDGTKPGGPDPTKWLLLSHGHACEVIVTPQETPPSPELIVGRQWRADPPGEESKVVEIPLAFESQARGEGAAANDVALALYSEIGFHLRALIDVRFKLLALVPPISALALVAIASGTGPFKEADDWLRAAAAFAGLIVTLGVRIYDVRNSELHDDLISRGRRLEHQLKISDGLYTRRRRNVWPVQHDFALFLVYGVVLLAWLAAALGWLVHASFALF